MYLPEAFQKKMKAILGEEYDDFLAGLVVKQLIHFL